MHRHLPSLLYFVVVIYVGQTHASSNELSRCCAGGARHYHETQTCLALRSAGSSITCSRTASICCLRALLDNSCSSGVKLAKKQGFCSMNVQGQGGGLERECCDCCLLAKDLVSRGAPCIAPKGFSSVCLTSFNGCCNKGHDDEMAETLSPLTSGIAKAGDDRCAVSRCEHMCNDRGGPTVECSCRVGYDLGPDGESCIDVDECLTLLADCLESQRCLNTPGSYKCIRTLSCGTGYAMDSETEECKDVDECNLGSHDCGPLYVCRNTQGSYRCDPKKCEESELMNPATGECTSVDCPPGYVPKAGRCEDIDECANPTQCSVYEECINSPGSYRCQEKGNLCSFGYKIDKDTGFCNDIDECASSVLNNCNSMACINLPGSYKCRCSAGYEFNETLKRCEDVDECQKFAGHMCSPHATCENTIGSFRCHCKPGFKLSSDGRNCDDIDECLSGLARCQQKCVNTPGSYQCICDRGYQLGSDELTCEDIDECTSWARSGNQLCMGSCINTPGSFKCTCPIGYEIQPDGITCKDIDECAQGVCAGPSNICINTLGAYKCQSIYCPPNYVPDKNYKNKIEDGYACIKECYPMDHFCLANFTKEILYQFRAIPTMKTVRKPIDVSNVLVQMNTPFSVEYVMDPRNSNYFLVEQKDNLATVKLRAPIKGPRIETIRLHINTKSRTLALLAHNIAIIQVDVSGRSF